MSWSPNFLAIVFKKQEILQQVVIRNRMQHLASEGATPSDTQHPVQAPRCWDPNPNLGPPQLFSHGCTAAWLQGLKPRHTLCYIVS